MLPSPVASLLRIKRLALVPTEVASASACPSAALLYGSLLLLQRSVTSVTVVVVAALPLSVSIDPCCQLLSPVDFSVALVSIDPLSETPLPVPDATAPVWTIFIECWEE